MPYHVTTRLAVLLAPVVLLSHASQEPSTFRSGVSAIEVDVFVTDTRGDPVRDLTKDDFELLEDGVAQPITHVSFIDLSVAPAPSGSAADSQLAASASGGRTIVMLLSGRAERIGKAAQLFVEHGMGPGDRMAVIGVLQSANPTLSFISSRTELMAAIDHFARGTGTARPEGVLPADGIAGRNVPAAAFLVAENVVTQLGAIGGRRKIVIWISPPSVFNSSRELEGVRAQRNALRAATRNNVAIYPVSVRGLALESGQGLMEMTAAYRAIADETGGEAIANTNNVAAAFERFLRDRSSYYLLAYEPAVEHTDGRFHEIIIKIKRPGLRVRSRRGYYAPGG
jgi:VWFA-related protein